jgi:hypothetical protein
VIAATTMPTRWTRSLATLLLVLQALAGSAVSLAHASEPLRAPIHIEAQHASACIALHDELRCTLCHYAGSQLQAQHPRTQLAAAAPTDGPLPRPGTAPVCRADRRTAPPRGPPSSRL